MNLLIHPTLESGTFHIVLQRILPCATLKSVSPFFFFSCLAFTIPITILFYVPSLCDSCLQFKRKGNVFSMPLYRHLLV